MGIIGSKVATRGLQQAICSGADMATREQNPHAKEQETCQQQQLGYLQ